MAHRNLLLSLAFVLCIIPTSFAQDVEIRNATDWSGTVEINGDLRIFSLLRAATGWEGYLDISAHSIEISEYNDIKADGIAYRRDIGAGETTSRYYDTRPGGGGGSHIGLGDRGNYGNDTSSGYDQYVNGGSSGKVYGNMWSFVSGAPGGNYDRESEWSSGRGGGALRLTADEIILRKDSRVTADGHNGSYSEKGGGGSGGSVWLIAKRIIIEKGALVSASGGEGYSGMGDGGGGLIRIAYTESFRCDGELRVAGNQPGLIVVQRIPSVEERDSVSSANSVTNGDLNNDGSVNGPDLLMFQAKWHK